MGVDFAKGSVEFGAQIPARSQVTFKKKKKKKHAQHGIVFFKEVISSHGEHREKQAFGWNYLNQGSVYPACWWAGPTNTPGEAGKRGLIGIIVFGDSLAITR